MFRRILTALGVPILLFGITFVVMAVDYDGPFSAHAMANQNVSHNLAKAAVYSIYRGNNVSSFTLTVWAGSNRGAPPVKQGSFQGDDSRHHEARKNGTKEIPTASAELTGTDRHGTTYNPVDTAP